MAKAGMPSYQKRTGLGAQVIKAASPSLTADSNRTRPAKILDSTGLTVKLRYDYQPLGA